MFIIRVDVAEENVQNLRWYIISKFCPFSTLFFFQDFNAVILQILLNLQLHTIQGVLISHWPYILPNVVGRNRWCRWKERSVHVPSCKSFLVIETERKHVRRRARFQ